VKLHCNQVKETCMLQTIEEIKKADLSAPGVINGVDNPNLLSVDSTTPFATKTDMVVSKDDITSGENYTPAKEEKKEEKEVKEVVVKKEEKEEKVAESTKEEKKLEEEVFAKKTSAEETTVETDSKPVKERIGKLTKRWRTAERVAETVSTKLRAAEDRIKELERNTPLSDKPKEEDFETMVEFVEALTDWKVENGLKGQKSTIAKETAEDVKKQTVDTAEEELNKVTVKGREKYEDYDTFVFSEDLTLTADMLEVITLSDIAEEVLYHLGKNPDIAVEISEMSSVKAAREIGKLEMELSALIPKPNTASDGALIVDGKVVPKATAKKLTKTPEPITPVKTTGITQKDPNDMSPKEYRAWREKK